MAGCGGCGSGGCNGPCSTNKGLVKTEPRVSMADALARVVVDNQVVVRAIELYEAGITSIQDIVVQINLDKAEGRL